MYIKHLNRCNLTPAVNHTFYRPLGSRVIRKIDLRNYLNYRTRNLKKFYHILLTSLKSDFNWAKLQINGINTDCHSKRTLWLKPPWCLFLFQRPIGFLNYLFKHSVRKLTQEVIKVTNGQSHLWVTFDCMFAVASIHAEAAVIKML